MIELALDEYADKKVQKLVKEQKIKLDHTFDDIEDEIRGIWLKENTLLHEENRKMKELNNQLQKMVYKKHRN